MELLRAKKEFIEIEQTSRVLYLWERHVHADALPNCRKRVFHTLSQDDIPGNREALCLSGRKILDICGGSTAHVPEFWALSRDFS